MKNRSRTFLAAAGLALLTVAATAQTNLVTNGSFETPVVPPGGTNYVAGTTFDGWTVGTNSVKHLSGPAAEGVQFVELNGTDAGSIYQDVTTTAAQIYVLRFAMAGNPATAGVRQMRVSWGGTEVDTLSFDTTGHTATDHGWVYNQYTVIGSGTNRVEFASITPGAEGPEVDDVSLLADDDADQVPNESDLCPGTPLGDIVDANGCSISQLVPCEGPITGGTWKNHGKYVSAVAHAANSFVAAGLISEEEKGAIVSAAARSDCGKKVKPPKPPKPSKAKGPKK